MEISFTDPNMESLRNALKNSLSAGAVSFEDSGEGERLEKFGQYLLRRPSSTAIWQRRTSQQSWENADAVYIPQKGWAFRDRPINDWKVDCGAFQIKLLPQENGQIGIFPEHLSYFEDLSVAIEKLTKQLNRAPRILNLFAYTGLASLWSALHGCEVTHIELSKRVLSWAKENQQLNPQISSSIRYIPEDALTFLDRETRRGSHYELIIADPPSFSRLSKTQSWDLDKVISSFISSLLNVLSPRGTIFLTSHHPALSGYVIENLIRDHENSTNKFVMLSRDLILSETHAPRILSCGSLTIIDRQ